MRIHGRPPSIREEWKESLTNGNFTKSQARSGCACGWVGKIIKNTPRGAGVTWGAFWDLTYWTAFRTVVTDLTGVTLSFCTPTETKRSRIGDGRDCGWCHPDHHPIKSAGLCWRTRRKYGWSTTKINTNCMTICTACRSRNLLEAGASPGRICGFAGRD